MSWLCRVWKSCDCRPLTGVTGSLGVSLSDSSPSSSNMGCDRSVGKWRGEDDKLESVWAREGGCDDDEEEGGGGGAGRGVWCCCCGSGGGCGGVGGDDG